MRFTSYSRYTGNMADALNLQALLDQLSDFLLNAGFAGGHHVNPWWGEFGGDEDDRSLDALKEALLRALREGWIAGAAIDTHYQYPLPPEHPLWRFPNVILTPHISGSGQSTHFLDRVWEIFAENVARWRSGRPLLNELSPAQLSGA